LRRRTDGYESICGPCKRKSRRAFLFWRSGLKAGEARLNLPPEVAELGRGGLRALRTPLDSGFVRARVAKEADAQASTKAI
jgi:hypothetical protein